MFGFCLHREQRRFIGVLRKVLFALLMTTLFLFLGFFGGLGYNVHAIKEVSFKPHSQLGYADAVFFCDITYNPILYPFYWVVGRGSLVGNFSVMYVPEGYMPGEFGGPIWGVKPEERYDAYINMMISWGTFPNLIFLFIMALAVEFSLDRSVYWVLLSGVFGFLFWEIYGAVIGIAVGIFAVLTIFKLFPNNFLRRLWQSIFG